jgi:4-hydroxy-tetrahydrodipicolinate synthase
MEEFVSAALGGDLAKVAELDKKLMPLYDGCFVESNPIPAKAGLSLLGLCTAEMRLPLTEAVPSTFDAMKRILADLD